MRPVGPSTMPRNSSSSSSDGSLGVPPLSIRTSNRIWPGPWRWLCRQGHTRRGIFAAFRPRIVSVPSPLSVTRRSFDRNACSPVTALPLSRFVNTSVILRCRGRSQAVRSVRDEHEASLGRAVQLDREAGNVAEVVNDAQQPARTPGRHPTPNPTRAQASPGGNSPPATGPGPGSRRSAARSPATATAGWPTCGPRIRPACRRSPPWAATTRVEAAQVATDEVWASR